MRFVRKMVVTWQEHENRFVERLGGPEEKDRLIAMLTRIFAEPREP